MSNRVSARPTVFHIPACPFSQRLKILLTLKGRPEAVDFSVVDITRPRDPEFLRKTRGATALPVMEMADGRILKESLVLLTLLDETVEGPKIRRADPCEHAVENMLIAKEDPFTSAGYRFVMNQDQAKREEFAGRTLARFRELNDFLLEHNPGGVFLFEGFGLAEAVYAPIFMRFWFLGYFEDFDLPEGPDYDRVRAWRDACLSHPAAQQVSREEIIKLYYDYALGAGNGALPPGRTRSSFVFEPDWRKRPWPPADKYHHKATDRELGLL
jgi:glutathione S-transferase